MMRGLRFFLAVALTYAATLLPAAAEKRVALVIGNSAYARTGQLVNPANDAKAVAALLRRAGFEAVEPKLDLGLAAFKRALSDFEVAAQGADIAAIYYSGHGIEMSGQNYLLPVDAVLARDVDVADEAISLDRVLRAAEGARRLRLVILDACRDNPFNSNMQRLGAKKSVTRGLAPPAESADTLVAFAARAGTQAIDGVPGANSPFTTALLRRLAEPGLDVQLAFRQIRDDVLAMTDRRQEPFTYGSLGGATIPLIGAQKDVAIPSAASDPAADYALAERIGTAQAWQAFLEQYPDGLYARFARAALAKIENRQPPVIAALPPRVQQPVVSADFLVGLITKTNDNPFFVKMKEGFEVKAKELGMKPQSFAGKKDGDAGTQIEAIENLIAAGAKGILITANNDSVVPALKKARAAGILVIALDTPIGEAGATDATFATDNFKAGILIGEWAKAIMGAKAASAKIGMLDINKANISVDVLRDTGFLKGFGINVPDLKVLGSENDKRVIGHESSSAYEEGGLRSTENLLRKEPGLNVIYAINEPAAAGAYRALKKAGKTQGVLIVSIDGNCTGIYNVKNGYISATSMQFPSLMASKGVEAVAEFARSGRKPPVVVDTGVELITDRPAVGIEALGSKEGLRLCWG